MTSRPVKIQVLADCLHCDGEGKVQVNCDDCGEPLFYDTIARDKNGAEEDICKACAVIRAEDEAAQPTTGEP